MAKKNMTPEERKAWGEKMKAAREAKKQNSDTVEVKKDELEAIMRRLQSLESGTPAPTTATTLNPEGRPMGVTEKYSLDPKDYEDPRERLYEMPEFKRDALRENYKLNWKVVPAKYQTIYGTWYIEPRFELEILRRRFDDETGEELKSLYLARMACFVDPAADLVEADNANLDYKTMEANEFAEAMRMYRWRKFIAETLRPPRITAKPRGEKMEVIGGRVYEVEDYADII